MGCDIHLHIEVKINGKWEHYHNPQVPRLYSLFEKMAGVRGSVKNAIVAPRGIPQDVSVITKFDYERMGSDGHSHSYLNAAEIDELDRWAKEKLHPLKQFPQWDMEWEWQCYFFENTFSGFNRYPKNREKGIEDLRFVFWFDN